MHTWFNAQIGQKILDLTCTFQVDFMRKLLPFHFFQDGRVIVFYSAHNGKNMFYRISEKPEDISSWGQG